jgi:hypothetical protein
MDWFLPSQAVSMGLTEEFKKVVEAERNMTPEQKAAWAAWHSSIKQRTKEGLVAIAAFAGIVGLMGLLFYGLRQ